MTDVSAAERAKSKRVGALRGLAPFIAPYRLMVVLAGLALIVTAGVSLVLPLAVRRVVDSFSRIVRLGEGLSHTGRLDDRAMDRAYDALALCAERVARKGLDAGAAARALAAADAVGAGPAVEWRLGRRRPAPGRRGRRIAWQMHLMANGDHFTPASYCAPRTGSNATP